MSKSHLPSLLLVAEVAEILEVSERTIQRLLDRGDLPGFKLGPHWRIPKEILVRADPQGSFASRAS